MPWLQPPLDYIWGIQPDYSANTWDQAYHQTVCVGAMRH